MSHRSFDGIETNPKVEEFTSFMESCLTDEELEQILMWVDEVKGKDTNNKRQYVAALVDSFPAEECALIADEAITKQTTLHGKRR
jgi:hypothetical protein